MKHANLNNNQRTKVNTLIQRRYAAAGQSPRKKNTTTLEIVAMVVSGTIAPSRELPELSAEETIRIILSNLNLIVPVVAALLVIIIAIVVICVLRSKGNHHKGTPALTNAFLSFFFLCRRFARPTTNTTHNSPIVLMLLRLLCTDRSAAVSRCSTTIFLSFVCVFVSVCGLLLCVCE